MRCLLCLIVFSLCLPPKNFGQKQGQEAKALLYNIGIGVVFGGIGAMINKLPDQTYGNALWRGSWQGAIGGGICYGSKKLTYLISAKEEPAYAWTAKITHAIGVSILENAAANRPFGETWNLHLGFIRLETDLKKDQFRARILPFAVVSTFMANRIGKFNFKRTLQTGTPFFESNGRIFNRFVGYSYWNDVTIDPSYSGLYGTIAHELIHTFQYREYLVLNQWVNPLWRRLEGKPWYDKLTDWVYFDIPYFIPFYELEGRFDSPCYYKNFFELEAELLSENRFIKICD